MPRQWRFGSLPCPKHHLSKGPERVHGHRTVSLTITDSTSTPAPVSVFSVSSTYTTPPNPTSSAELFPGPTDLPAAATIPNSESKSAVISNKFPTLHSNASPAPVPLPDANTPHSTSTTSPCTVSLPTLQIHLLWLLVPTSLLASSELLLGTGSESPAFCAPPSCAIRYYHSQ